MALSTEFPDDFHIGKFGGEGGRAASDSRFLTIKPFGMTTAFGGRAASGALIRATVWPSVWNDANFGLHLRAARDGRLEIEKRSLWRSLL